MFEYSLVAGLTASGADAYLLHVTTTPSVAYIARVDDFDCGIMISASHNPYYDNGIKLIDCYGEKMPEETLLLVEDYIDGKLHVFDKDWPELPFAHREHIGCTVDYVAGRNLSIVRGLLRSNIEQEYHELYDSCMCNLKRKLWISLKVPISLRESQLLKINVISNSWLRWLYQFVTICMDDNLTEMCNHPICTAVF